MYTLKKAIITTIFPYIQTEITAYVQESHPDNPARSDSFQGFLNGYP